jgi:uncharacterized protein (UPF0332 family)
MNNQNKNDLIAYRLKKADDTLNEVKILIQNHLWSTAINRIYYACFYAVSALLLTKNITTGTHGGVRRMFGLHFVKTGTIPKDLGKFYSDIFDMRHSGDYDDFVDFSDLEVSNAMIPAKELIEKIKTII